jgi:hypothetical protein
MVLCNLPPSSPLHCLSLLWVPNYFLKKPYFPCKVLEAKMVDREDAFKSFPLFRFLAQKKSLIFSARWQILKCTQGNCIFISMALFKSFPLFRHCTSKNKLFSLKCDRNKNVQKEISFCSQGLHQFSPASTAILCKNPSFPLNEKRIGSLHFPFNCKGDSLRFSDFQTEDPPHKFLVLGDPASTLVAW